VRPELHDRPGCERREQNDDESGDHGQYRVVAKANPADWFRESDESNNAAWADIRLTTSVRLPRVEVVRSRLPQPRKQE
jgi:hypothetical protein